MEKQVVDRILLSKRNYADVTDLVPSNLHPLTRFFDHEHGLPVKFRMVSGKIFAVVY